jgi:ankyrin repeat protein
MAFSVKKFFLYSVLIAAFSLLYLKFWPRDYDQLLAALKANDLPQLNELIKAELMKLRKIQPAADINSIELGEDRGLIHAAAMYSSAPTIEFLYNHGINLNNQRRYDFRSELHFAAIFNSPEVVQLLIELGSDIHSRTYSTEFTPLLYSILYSNHENAQKLIAAGADINDRVKEGLNTVQYAIVYSDWAMVELLIRAGASVDYQDKYYDDYVQYKHTVQQLIEREKQSRKSSAQST